MSPTLPLATVAEFARARKVTPRTVQRWIARGQLPTFRITRTRTGGFFHLIPPFVTNPD